MSHAETPPNEDRCPCEGSERVNARCGTTACTQPGLTTCESLARDMVNNRLPVQVAREDAEHFRTSTPYVLNAGQMLFVVTEDEDAWVVAEMRFDPEACLFTEARVSRFTWPREAFGRLMSRAVIGESIDEESAERVTRGFSGWLAAQFVA